MNLKILAFFPKILLVHIVFYSKVIEALNSGDDPYEVLGVSRSATAGEIKRAYKRLARNWHPDRNKDPKAQEMFIKINRANEILSDEEKRKQYDNFGEADGHPRYQHQSFFDHQNGFQFFFDGGMPFENSWQTEHITMRAFENSIVPGSHEKPYVLLVTSAFCFLCMEIKPLWENFAQEVKTLGVGTGVVNGNHDHRLVDRLGVTRVPSIVGIISGRMYYFDSDKVTVRNLRRFVKSLFSGDIVQQVSLRSLDSFLEVEQDNKPRVILLTPKSSASLLYYTVAFAYRNYVVFGYASLAESSGEKLRRKYKMDEKVPSVLVFKEEKTVPEVVVKGTQLKSGRLRSVVAENKFLNLPRLSSPDLFKELCPEERFKTQRRLCVILFTKKGQHRREEAIFRTAMTKTNNFKDKVRFTYLYEDVQKKVAQALESKSVVSECKNGTSFKLAVLWSKGGNEVVYDWLAGGWCISNMKGGDGLTGLEEMLDALVNGKRRLQCKAKLPDFSDEHGLGFLALVYKKGGDIFYSLKGFIWRKEMLTMTSFILTIVFLVIVSGCLPLASEAESISNVSNRYDNKPMNSTSYDNVYEIMQLDQSTEHVFLRDTPPGQLSIVLLLDVTHPDEAASSPIMQAFKDVIYTHSRNRSLRFAWLSTITNLNWCTEVMNTENFGEFRPGTVLCINGHRQYVCIFKPSDVPQTMYSRSQDGDLMGFNDSDNESDSSTDDGVCSFDRKYHKLISQTLRNELPTWMDRLCEGMIKRVKVDYWPLLDA